MTLWLLNLDAEKEMEHVGAHTPSKQTRLQVMRVLPWLRETLLGPTARVLEIDGEDAAGETVAKAWSPTLSARETMRRIGLTLEPVPEWAVLRAVNDRRFCAELGQTLPRARWCISVEQVLETLEQDGSATWLLKRAFGFAGKGRRRVTRLHWQGDDARWVENSLGNGCGLQVEPWVERVNDYSLHGELQQDGSARMGVLTKQVCSDQGVWLSSERVKDEAVQHAMEHEWKRVVVALRTGGYWGPFGLDGYTWKRADGCIEMQPRSEINARYSMGWGVGMGVVEARRR